MAEPTKEELELMMRMILGDKYDPDYMSKGKRSDQWSPVDRVEAGLDPRFEVEKAFPRQKTEWALPTGLSPKDYKSEIVSSRHILPAFSFLDPLTTFPMKTKSAPKGYWTKEDYIKHELRPEYKKLFEDLLKTKEK